MSSLLYCSAARCASMLAIRPVITPPPQESWVLKNSSWRLYAFFSSSGSLNSFFRIGIIAYSKDGATYFSKECGISLAKCQRTYVFVMSFFVRTSGLRSILLFCVVILFLLKIRRRSHRHPLHPSCLLRLPEPLLRPAGV